MYNNAVVIIWAEVYNFSKVQCIRELLKKYSDNSYSFINIDIDL